MREPSGEPYYGERLDGERLEEVIAAEQGALTEGEEALLELLCKKLHRELRRAA